MVSVAESAARGARKPVLLIVSPTSVEAKRPSDRFLVVVPENVWACAPHLNTAIDDLKRWIVGSIEPTFFQNVSSGEIDREGWEPGTRECLRTIGSLLRTGKNDEAVSTGLGLLEKDPECWRAGIAVSTGLVMLTRYQEADEMLGHVLEWAERSHHPPAISYACQNKAWLIAERAMNEGRKLTRGELEQSRDFNILAIQCQPRVAIYLNLMADLVGLQEAQAALDTLRRCLTEVPGSRRELLQLVDMQQSEFQDSTIREELERLLQDREGSTGPERVEPERAEEELEEPNQNNKG